ncbi:MAG: Imm1 family immunity protein [Solirubrobacterales bacterium]
MAEQLHITALVIATWSGSDVHEERIEGDALSVDAVAAAVTALDGEERNDVYLESAGDTTLVVAGGPELCFLYATFDNMVFLIPETGREGDPVELVAGGQVGIFPADNLVDCETAAAVAATWARTGELDTRVGWRES